MRSDHVLPDEPIGSLDEYTARGGGAGLEAAARLGVDGVLDELEASGLRGRGGAWFPTATKWRSIVAGGPAVGDRFAVANGAEGEPATFKDRMLLRRNPYQVVEGLLIAARTVGAREAFVAVKADFGPERAALERASSEMADAGWTDDLPLTIVAGPDEYLYGEEKGLLEVIEGEDPLPRFFPPYVYGLFTAAPQMGWSAGVDRTDAGPGRAASNPTLVNNVETLALATAILARGATWFRSLGGTDASPGITLVTVCGDTMRTDVAEVALGTPLREVIADVGGGLPEGRRVKAVLSGVANPVLVGDRIDTPLTAEDLDAAGSSIGAAGFVVYDDTRNMVAVAHAMSRFLAVESCGQCPPCKWGSQEITHLLNRMLCGEGTRADLGTIANRLERVTDANRCYLGLEERLVVGSLLDAFPDDVTAVLDEPREWPEPVVPKLLDVSDGVGVVDGRVLRKRPDWTYDEQPRRRTPAPDGPSLTLR